MSKMHSTCTVQRRHKAEVQEPLVSALKTLKDNISIFIMNKLEKCYFFLPLHVCTRHLRYQTLEASGGPHPWHNEHQPNSGKKSQFPYILNASHSFYSNIWTLRGKWTVSHIHIGEESNTGSTKGE